MIRKTGAMITTTNKDKLFLILSMVIWGSIGIFRRYIPLGSAPLAMARGVIGTVFLLVLLAVKGQKLSVEAVKRNGVLLLVSGAFIGINWILLFEAYNYTTVAIATLCYYMAPILVILVSPIVLREHLGRKKIVCVIIALIGMICISGILDSAEETGELKGILFGLGAAVFYASVILMNKKIHDISAYDKTIIQMGSAALVLLPYVLLTGQLNGITLDGMAIAMILVVGVVHTGIAYALYFGSMDKIPAQTVALFSYIDPVVAILLSAFLLSEKMGVYEMIGTICVLGATIISELPDKIRK